MSPLAKTLRAAPNLRRVIVGWNTEDSAKLRPQLAALRDARLYACATVERPSAARRQEDPTLAEEVRELWLRDALGIESMWDAGEPMHVPGE